MENEPNNISERYFQCIKSFESGSAKLSTWSLSVFGGSILIVVSDSYLRPLDSAHRFAYWLFLIGWILVGLSLYHGFSISRSVMVLDLYTRSETSLATIFKACNSSFRKQLKFFQWGLLVFGTWLVLYLYWWICMEIPISK